MAFQFEHLDIWKNACYYNKKIYLLTKKFPREELFSLTDQVKRASLSIPTNIAKGSGSNTKKDFSHFLDIAIKSAYETISLLFIAKEQSYILQEEYESMYRDAEILVKQIKSFKTFLK